MPDKLLIVESPAKARTISKFLKQDFLVTSTYGHIRDLPENSLGINIEKNFEPYYEILPKKKKIISQIKKSCESASDIYLATDPDREGEAIAWHITQSAKIKNPKRIEFHEITKEAILKALKEPKEININLVNAQQARRILDRLVGYKISPFLWRKIKTGLSAGRVQSVGLRLVVEREKEIENFIKTEYWNIVAILSKQDDEGTFEAKLIEKNKEKIKIENKTDAQKIVDELNNLQYKVSDIKIITQKRSPSPPFITSTLQQEASRRYGFSPTKTMFLAQQLYEGISLGKESEIGLITYHRTDSTNISDVARAQGIEYLRQKYGEEYVEKTKRIFKVPKASQQAHEAIRPTSVFREPEDIKKYLSPDLYKLYKLIHSRFSASLSTSAIYQKTQVDIQAGDYLFRTEDTICLFLGYKKVLGYEEEDEENKTPKLPKLSIDELLKLIELKPSQHFTQPPQRYTEATLVKALEEKGIGRPSTYAPILETLKQRKYVEKKEKYLHPTSLGKIVVEILMEKFSEIMDIQFTAKMEDDLDKIEEGEINWRNIISQFYFPFSKTLELAYQDTKRITIPQELSSEVCEKCGKQMIIRDGRYGKFIACLGYPECKNIKSLKKNNTTNIKCSAENCDGYLVKRRGKNKRIFYGCSKYPQCKFITYKLPEKNNVSNPL